MMLGVKVLPLGSNISGGKHDFKSGGIYETGIENVGKCRMRRGDQWITVIAGENDTGKVLLESTLSVFKLLQY